MLAWPIFFLTVILAATGLVTLIYVLNKPNSQSDRSNLIPDELKIALGWGLLVLAAGCGMSCCIIANKLF